MTAITSNNLCPEVNFICSAVDLPSTVLRWFFNDVEYATYVFGSMHEFPQAVQTRNTTYTEVSGVDIQILNASLNEDNQDVASFLSAMTANISALQGAGVSTVSCGSSSIRSTIDTEFDSSRG